MMKAITLVAALAASMTVAPAVANPIAGQWVSPNGKMTIDIQPCGAAQCGTVIRASTTQQAKAERGSGTKLMGARLISDIVPVATNRWRGSVFLPDRNMRARGAMRLLPDGRLEVSGCVLGLVCRSRIWSRPR